MLKIFALSRLPILLFLFAGFLLYYRRRGKCPCTPLPALILPLAGLLLTSAGDLSGECGTACWIFGAGHLCMAAFLIRRGRFSWRTAGILLFLLIPLLAAVVLPSTGSEPPFFWLALCSVLSIAAAVGARRSPGGMWYAAGLTTLTISQIGIGAGFAGVCPASPATVPLYAVSMVILSVALIRSIPEAPPIPEPVPLSVPVLCCRSAMIMLILGLLVPLFIIGAMVFYNGHYSWYGQIVSESGFVHVASRPNHLSAWLLSSGLTCAGILCGWYFVERFRRGAAPRWQRWAILFSGVLGGIGLVGIGAIPLDRHPDLHNFCTLCSVPFGFAILFSLLTPRDLFGRFGEKMIWLTYTTVILSMVGAMSYLITLKSGGLPHKPTDPLIQKITISGFYVFMMGQIIMYAVNAHRALAASKKENGI
ncbi:MAG: hypothetical protein J5944_11485 [Lentisphaeria bacterium]|nr:hypothetical protein [Lentisphaeria bacterium]